MSEITSLSRYISTSTHVAEKCCLRHYLPNREVLESRIINFMPTFKANIWCAKPVTGIWAITYEN